MTYTSRGAKDGFTLIEILVAIAIVAIMAVVVVPNFMRYLEKGRRTSAEATLRAVKTAVNQFNADTTQYPETLRNLTRKPSNEQLAKKWMGPYIEKELGEDPWGNKYKYKVTSGQAHPYDLYSYGSGGPGAAKAEWLNVWDL